jgi:hypothetical protein
LSSLCHADAAACVPLQTAFVRFDPARGRCGIHNLHGLPSLVGGIASIVCGFTLTSPVVGAPSVQLAGIGVTLLVSISSGAFTGFVLKKFWEVADDFGKGV